MTKLESIRVRFAPSPTGFLHIGGARTALFNFLFARRHHGQFLLRIEDTDQARSDSQLIEIIFQNLKWLGLKWDEEPVYQSQHFEKYRYVCAELLKKNNVYPCFCSQDVLREKREEALKMTGEYRYDRTCLQISVGEAKERMERGDPFVLRFHVPEGETQFEDGVRGKVTVNHQELDDFVIQRSDGSPVYQVAVVVDDHDMAISHVVRGDDHLSNTPKQILIYKAMDWPVPQFAHVPLILGSDKKRLSKRHGATSVTEYERGGILPEALVNFLGLLGWSPGDNREILSLQEMIDSFSIERISKNPAVFDEMKLTWMNAQYIHARTDLELTKCLLPSIIQVGWIQETDMELQLPYIQKCVGLFKERMKTLTDFIDTCAYFFCDPPVYEEKAVQKHWMKEGVLHRMELILEALQTLQDWNTEELEKIVRDLAEEEGVGAGKYIHPVRLALTGSGISPGLFEVMEILGREVVLKRLSKAAAFLSCKR